MSATDACNLRPWPKKELAAFLQQLAEKAKKDRRRRPNNQTFQRVPRVSDDPQDLLNALCDLQRLYSVIAEAPSSESVLRLLYPYTQ